jgi:tRNA(fMet)-specific endonuclease VapC
MQSYIIVDTDVFSYLWQGRNQADRYEAALKNTIPVLSFTSIAEIYFGAYSAGWGDQRLRQLEAAVRPYLVVPWDSEIAKLWGKLKSQARSQGHPLGQNEHGNDLWICATAIRYDAQLLTNNVRHFEAIPGLRLLNV